ncbi:MAG: DegV family protein [Chloroherpetonaceae bacterium]|nr:DegV family protein [Chloroherpetonaceae bacterium]
MRTAILTDSNCDLPQDLLYQYDIRVIPTKVIVEGKIRYDNYHDFDRTQFYQSLLDGKKSPDLTIEAPSSEEFLQTYRKLCLDYDVILSIHESSKFGDTVKNARQGAVDGSDTFKRLRLLKNIGAPFQIRIIDSKNTSLGLGLLVLRAAELLTQQVSSTKLANELEELADKIFLYLIPNDLGFLRNAKKGVKVGLLGAGLASITDTKPVFAVHRGEIIQIEKKRGFDAAINDAMQQVMKKLSEERSYDKVGITYGGEASLLETIETVTEFRVQLAGMGLGSLLSNLTPQVGIFMGPKSLGLSMIHSDINITSVFSKPT